MNFNNNNNKKMNNEVELNNNKGEITMNKKELKKINKKETCGGFSVNREFGKEFRQLTGECATLTKVEKIRDIISKEIDNEVITTQEELLQRRTELVHELYILGEEVQPREKEVQPQVEEVQTKEKELEASNNKYQIELPYTSSGIMMGYGRRAFGGAGFLGSRIGEGETKWRLCKCYVKENGLSIEETGDFVRFDKIKSINTGEEEGILIKHINICLELKNEERFSFRVKSMDLSLLKIIEDNIIPESNITVENNNSGLDELLKAKELLDAGLLTEEEFYELKYKILDNI